MSTVPQLANREKRLKETSRINKAMQDLEIPSFRIKKSHKKSRLGCITCKQRRVKCDEIQPACKQCRRRGLSCAYGASPVSSGVSPESQHSSKVADVVSPDSTVLDTALMRHFLAHTVEGFATTSIRNEHYEQWKIVIPALAYSHAAVRHGLLTAGALCMHYDACLESQVASKYFIAAKAHGELFIQESRAQARRFDSSEFEAIVACSRLLSILGVAFYRIHRANGVNLDNPAAWTWLHLVRGVKTVYTAIHESGASFDPIVSLDMIPEVGPRPGLCIAGKSGMQWHRTSEAFRVVHNTQCERFESLFAALLSRQSHFSQDAMADIEAEIVSLENVTRHICTGEVHSLQRAIYTWPGGMSSGFSNLLLDSEPLALVVYAHWLMLVVLARDMWWFDDMGEVGIREAAAICSRSDPSLEPLLRWPLSLLDSVDR